MRGVESSARANWALPALGGCVLTNVAFAVPIASLWTRLILVISLLGLVGVVLTRDAPSWWRRPRPHELVLGAVTGVGMAVAAWLLMMLALMRAQTAYLTELIGGHSTLAIATTLPLAVLGEELFWRATVLRLAVARLGT